MTKDEVWRIIDLLVDDLTEYRRLRSRWANQLDLEREIDGWKQYLRDLDE